MTDLITMQVIRYALEQIADEMGHTLVRTGRSTIITEIKDISCVVTDAKGQTMAQAHHTPSLLAGFEITMRELVKTYRPENLEPGDVIVTNDPYRGCQHIMDLYAIAPAFHHGELVGFVGNITHHTDLGGVAAGGVAGGIREIYLEGLRLPMVKLSSAVSKTTNSSASSPTKFAFPTRRSAISVPRFRRSWSASIASTACSGSTAETPCRPHASICSTTPNGACARACKPFRRSLLRRRFHRR